MNETQGKKLNLCFLLSSLLTVLVTAIFTYATPAILLLASATSTVFISIFSPSHVDHLESRINILFWTLVASAFVPSCTTYAFRYKQIGVGEQANLVQYFLWNMASVICTFTAIHLSHTRFFLFFGASLFGRALHCAVKATGGPTYSPFSFYYLFFPSMVAIIFPAYPPIIWGAFLSCLSFIWLTFFWVAPGAPDVTSRKYKFEALILFIFYLIVLLCVEVNLRNLPLEGAK